MAGNKTLLLGGSTFAGVGALFTFLGLVMFINFDSIKDSIEGNGPPILLPIIFTALGIMALVIGVWMLLNVRKAAKRNRRLVQAGNYVVADIVDDYPDYSMTMNGCPATRLVCEWTDPSTGTTYQFESDQFFGGLNKYRNNPRLIVYVDVESGYEDYYVDLKSKPPVKSPSLEQ